MERTMADRGYPMVITQLSEDEGGGYLAFAPDLRGCMADGDTPEAAMADLFNAIEEWIDETNRLGREIPPPGWSAAKAHQEKNEIDKLIKAQERLIEAQDGLLKTMREEVDQAREIMESLSRKEDAVVSAYDLWGPDESSPQPTRHLKRLHRVRDFTN
jgi:antitoxin HicB